MSVPGKECLKFQGYFAISILHMRQGYFLGMSAVRDAFGGVSLLEMQRDSILEPIWFEKMFFVFSFI